MDERLQFVARRVSRQADGRTLQGVAAAGISDTIIDPLLGHARRHILHFYTARVDQYLRDAAKRLDNLRISETSSLEHSAIAPEFGQIQCTSKLTRSPPSAARDGRFSGGRYRRRPVHSRTPARETGHPIRSPSPARSRNSLRSHKLPFTMLWLSNCPSFHVPTSPRGRP